MNKNLNLNLSYIDNIFNIGNYEIINKFIK